MLTTIGWAALGFFIGGLAGMFSITLVASKNVQRIAMLESANVRLIADVATASVNNVQLERDVVRLRGERDKWHAESMKVIDVFVGPTWRDKMPGEAG